MGVDAKTLVLVGAAVAAPSLAQLGKSAGLANTAAAGAFPRTVAGVAVSIPSGAKMVDVWHAMRRALGDKTLTVAQLIDVCDAWLGAYAAGASADELNYSLLSDDVDFGDLTNRGATSDVSLVCNDSAWSAFASPLGKAVCALYKTRTGLHTRAAYGVVAFGEQGRVYDQARAVAVAMDEADFRRDGDRRSDSSPSGLLDAPGALVGYVGQLGGKLLGSAAGAVLGSPTFILVAVGGIVAWKVLR